MHGNVTHYRQRAAWWGVGRIGVAVTVAFRMGNNVNLVSRTLLVFH